MPRGTVLGLVKFDFGYRSAIATLNSGLILGLLASKSNSIEAIYGL